MNWRGTTFRDWLLFAFGLAGLAISLAMLMSEDEGSARLAFFAIFGMCAVASGHSILAKLRVHRVALDPSLRLPVTGGVPLVGDRARAVRMALGTIGVGVFLAISGEPMGQGFVVVSLLIAGLGLAALVTLPLGWRRLPSLTFTPEGLRVENPSITYVARWDAMTVRLLMVQERPSIRVWLHHPARTVSDAQVSLGVPAMERAKLATRFERSLRWSGFHQTFSGTVYRVETLLLLRALQGYVDHPAARAERG